MDIHEFVKQMNELYTDAYSHHKVSQIVEADVEGEDNFLTVTGIEIYRLGACGCGAGFILRCEKKPQD